MSKLDDLIREYCPDGVEYKKVKDVFNRLKGTAITAEQMKKINNPKGDIKIFAGGKTIVHAKEQDISNANITRVPAVLVQSRGIIDVIYCETPFTFKNEMWAYTAQNPVSVKFLYHCLKNNVRYFRRVATGMGSLPQISLPVTEDFLIPIPPIEVQNKIVQILDTFTELTAELTAELSARQKQYEYYRDILVKFEGQVPGVEYKKLSAVCKSLPKGTLKQEELVKDGLYPVVNSGKELYGYYNDFNNDGDAVIVASRGNAGYVSYQGGKFWAGGLCYPYASADESTVSTKYIYYALKAKENTICNTLVSKGGVPALNKQDLDAVKIPVPPIDVQQQVVSILDQFYTLSSDIGTGLPAEIAAREKQYEFFRDKILTFKGVTPPPHDSRAADCG